MKILQHWKAASLWLCVLGPLFFLIYGGANGYAASLPADQVGSLAWDWERHIPLLPWTIVPYWSIDLMFGVSLFLCRNRDDLRVQGLRLLVTILLSCLFFVLFPLRFSFDRPPVEGLFGPWFTALAGFDRPFNQAPSLHIGLLVVIWSCFRRNLASKWFWVLDIWCALIAVSVLTTWQHHFLDIPTGAALGFVVAYLLPFPEHRRQAWKAADAVAANRLALRYLLPGLLLSAIAFVVGGWAWLLLWPGLVLCLLAHAYWRGGPTFWQKTAGRRSLPARLLLSPVLRPLQLVQARYRRELPGAQVIVDDVYVGPISAAADPQFVAVLDLTGEYQRHAHPTAAYHQIPLLDLLLPNAEELDQAVAALENLRTQHQGPLLVHCALGMTRSAAVVLAWLVRTGRSASLEHAWQLLNARRDQVMLSPAALEQLEQLCRSPA